MITKSDKDGKIVLLDKETYISKIHELLNDTETYDKLMKDPTTNIVAQYNKSVRTIGGTHSFHEGVMELHYKYLRLSFLTMLN